MLPIPHDVCELLTRLEKAGHIAYLVGGCVRDLLLGRSPHDWDIATSALPEQTCAALFPLSTRPTGIQHGTVTVQMHSSIYEITTFRRDEQYSDHRHPASVQFSSLLEEDVLRRDFTVNALAYHPKRGLVDLVGGQADLQKRCLRCVGDPTVRFSEDALRILRGLRFSAQLGFSLEPRTWQAMKQSLPLLDFISSERKNQEFAAFLRTRFFAHVLPQSLPFWQRAFHLPNSSFSPSLQREAALLPRHFLLRLALFCRIFSLQEAQDLLALRFSKKTSCLVAQLLTEQKPLVPIRAHLRKRLSQTSPALLFLAFSFQKAHLQATRPSPFAQRRLTSAQKICVSLLKAGECCCLSQLALRGEDLFSLALSPKQRGQMLQILLRAVQEGRCPNEKNALLSLATQNLPSKE